MILYFSRKWGGKVITVQLVFILHRVVCAVRDMKLAHKVDPKTPQEGCKGNGVRHKISWVR